MARRGKKYEGPMCLVWDEADPDSETVNEKIRFAVYASFDEALMQAEHDLKSPAALDRHREVLGRLDLSDEDVPLPEGRRIVGIIRKDDRDHTVGLEGIAKKLIWSPGE